MSARIATRLAWGVWALSPTLIAVNIVFLVLNRRTATESGGLDASLGVGFLVVFLAFASSGALIVARQPGNPIGWILSAIGLTALLASVGDGYLLYTLRTDPGSLPSGDIAAWVVGWLSGPPVIAFVAFIFLVFPGGGLVSRRWRPFVWLGLLGLVLVFALSLLPGEIETLSSVAVENPLGIAGAESALEIIGAAGFALIVLATGGGVASLVVRFRTARGDERQQLKWFAFAATLFLLAFVSGPVIWNISALESTPLWPIVFLLAIGTLPLATGVAILRYRLYDIDVVINRTLVYGSLTALLAGAYFGLVLLFQLALEPVTEGNELAVAASTLAVAALFRPARRHIQGLVDRRFYRRKYDAERTLEAFGARLRDEVELDTLARDLRGVVAETVQPAHVSLWLREAGR
jgi:hypothetical protein